MVLVRKLRIYRGISGLARVVISLGLVFLYFFYQSWHDGIYINETDLSFTLRIILESNLPVLVNVKSWPYRCSAPKRSGPGRNPVRLCPLSCSGLSDPRISKVIIQRIYMYLCT
jgi:hypothetical protein